MRTGFDRTFREIASRAAHRQRKLHRQRFLAGDSSPVSFRRKGRRLSDLHDRRWLAAATADEIAMGIISDDE